MNPNYSPANNYPYDPRQYPQVPTVPSNQIHPQHPHHLPPNHPAYSGYNYGYGYPASAPGGAYPGGHYPPQGVPNVAPTHAPAPKTPVKVQEIHIEQWIPTEDERSAIDAWFIEIDHNFQGFIGGADAVQFFKRSNLPKEVLREVWSLADHSKSGKLDRTQFFFAIRMIAVLCSPIYAGSKPTIELYNSTIHKRIPLPSQLNKAPEVEKKVEEKKVEAVPPSQPPVAVSNHHSSTTNHSHLVPPQLHPSSQPHIPPQSHPISNPHPGYHQSAPVGFSPYGYSNPAHPPSPAAAAYSYPHHYVQPVAHLPSQPPAAGYPGYYNTASGYALPTQPIHNAGANFPASVSKDAADEEFSDFTEAAPNPIPSVGITNHPQSSASNAPVISSLPHGHHPHEHVAATGRNVADDEEFSDFAVAAPSTATVSGSTARPNSEVANNALLISDDLLLLGPQELILKREELTKNTNISAGGSTTVVSNEEDEFSEFASATANPTVVSQTKSVPPLKAPSPILLEKPIHGNQTALAQPVSSVSLLDLNQKADPAVSQQKYDASKLSIFDDMVENDLMALKEDWEDFSGPSAVNPKEEESEVATTAKDQSIVTEAPSLSVNPFDEFGEFEAPTTPVVYPYSTTIHEAPEVKETSLVIDGKEQEEEDFGEFETHNPPPLQRADSLHRSAEVVDLKDYYQHSKHRPEDTPDVSAKFSSVAGSEDSFKQAIFIEDSIHRSGEVVDFHAFHTTPAPALTRKATIESMRDTEIEDNNDFKPNESEKTIMSYADMIDVRSEIASEYNSAKYDLSRMTSLQSLSLRQNEQSVGSFTSEDYYSTKVSENPSAKSAKHLDEGDDDDADPFADIEIDPHSKLEFALSNPLPEVKESPPEKKQDLKEKQKEKGTDKDEFDFGDLEEEEELGEFQDFQSCKESGQVPDIPHSSTHNGSSQPVVVQNTLPANSSNYELGDLLDFSDDHHTIVSPPNTGTIVNTVNLMTDFDLLSLDYAPAPSSALSQQLPSVVVTAFDEEGDDFDPFVSAEPHKSEGPQFEANFVVAFDPFEHNNSSVQNDAPISSTAHSSTSVEQAPATLPTANTAASTLSTASTTTNTISDKPLTLQNLEVLAVQLYEQNHYEAAYNCTRQTTLLRQITDLSEQKQHALENDDLELAVSYKKQIKELLKYTVSSEIEQQWQQLANNTSNKTTGKANSVQDYFLKIKKTKTIPNNLLQKIQSRYFQPSQIPEKNAPLIDQLQYYLLTKRSLKMIDYLLSQQIYERYEQIYRELLQLIKAKVVLVQQSIQQYAQIQKVAVQLEIKLHPRMQSFLQESKILLEHAIYLAVVATELLFFDNHPITSGNNNLNSNNSSSAYNNGRGKSNNNNGNNSSSNRNDSNKAKNGVGVGGNLALDVFDVSQEVLAQLSQYFDIKSEVLRKPIDEIAVDMAMIVENIARERIEYCHLLFRPLSKQIEDGKSGKVVFSKTTRELNHLSYSLPLINLLQKEKKEFISDLLKIKQPFQ